MVGSFTQRASVATSRSSAARRVCIAIVSRCDKGRHTGLQFFLAPDHQFGRSRRGGSAKSATKSAMVKSISCPTAEMTGIFEP